MWPRLIAANLVASTANQVVRIHLLTIYQRSRTTLDEQLHAQVDIIEEAGTGNKTRAIILTGRRTIRDSNSRTTSAPADENHNYGNAW